MKDEIKLDVREYALTDDALEIVVGGFAEGETIRLKSGRTTCIECGMRNITNMICCGQGGTLRLALVTLLCGHQPNFLNPALTSA